MNPYKIDGPVVVSFGGGVNSTALLCGLAERSVRPDAILFADTGGEFERTYAHVEAMSAWCVAHGQPAIQTVSYDTSKHASLEAECIANKTLPSKAFGFAGCSVKWKRHPMDRWIAKWPVAIQAWNAGGRVTRVLGIDAGEAHRGLIEPSTQFVYVRPLVEWGWDRDDCLKAIKRGGAPMPEKSACWFCPASRKSEVRALAIERPDLFARAVAMEHNAAPNLGVVRGLGRHWSWEELARADAAQGKLFQDPPELSCACYDGEQP